MRIMKTTTAVTLGLVLALGACSGGESADADSEETAAEEEANTAADHDPMGYATDSTGMVASELGETALDSVNERLAAHHAASGDVIHMHYVNERDSTDDVAAATSMMNDSEADALIYINVGDEEITVVGENIDENESSTIGSAMVESFDQENFEDGMTNAVNSTIEAMEN